MVTIPRWEFEGGGMVVVTTLVSHLFASVSYYHLGIQEVRIRLDPRR
jgi:hypothetical protein